MGRRHPLTPSIITSRHPRYINGPGFLAWDRGRHFHRPRAARQWLCEKRWEAALPLRVSPSSSLSSTCAFFTLLSARLTTGGPLRVTRTFYLHWPAAELSVTVADTDSPPLQLHLPPTPQSFTSPPIVGTVFAASVFWRLPGEICEWRVCGFRHLLCLGGPVFGVNRSTADWSVDARQ